MSNPNWDRSPDWGPLVLILGGFTLALALAVWGPTWLLLWLAH